MSHAIRFHKPEPEQPGIDVHWYANLPRDQFLEFNDWLEREKLLNKHIVEITEIGEGFVGARRLQVIDGSYSCDPAGDPIEVDDKYIVHTPPPGFVISAWLSLNEKTKKR